MILRHAAEYLTPVTLELGGKSPCIVDSTAKIRLNDYTQALAIRMLSAFIINTIKRRQHVIYLRNTITTSPARTLIMEHMLT